MEFRITNQNKNATYHLQEKWEEGVLFLVLHVDFSEETVPKPISVLWDYSGADCYSTWNPRQDAHGLGYDWEKQEIDSRLASWMPMHALISKDGKNKLHIAVSDVNTPIRVGTGVCEEGGTMACEVTFFTVPIAAMRSYSAVIRLDMRDIPYYDSIYDTVTWWEIECGYTPAYVPESAKLPMDSLWYSFHQMLDHEEILKECRASKSMGLETVIIDDGWQTDDVNRGYAFCGDWQVAESKMGNMAELVEKIHDIGMKVILWYSVPYVGIRSKKYEEFKGCFLDSCGNGPDSVALDPRYKKVREYLVKTYTDAAKEWKLDGFKLDFIDSFALRGKSLEYDEKRDYISLEDGVHALMKEVKASLTAINPEIMIEFRQTYVGPAIREYGNMLRVGDCPCDILRNRVGIVNLRFTSGKTAVHSDMLMWNMEDTAENAALQFSSILYGVPQISVRVDKLPQEHLQMLKHYLSFWYENRRILLDGKLTAQNPEENYSQVCATLDDKAIYTVYSNSIVEVTTKDVIIVNSSMHSAVIVKNAEGKQYRVVNCKGEQISQGEITAQLFEVAVPTAGIVYMM